MISIRRANLDDRPELYKFIQLANKDCWQYRIPDRWEWEYIHNPCLVKGALPVFIAIKDTGEIVGQSCTMVEQVKIGRETYCLGWGVDAYVLPEYRSQGIGFKLQKANDESQELFMSLSMASAVRKMKLSLGSVVLDPVPVYRRYMKFSIDIFRNSGFKLQLQKHSLLQLKLPFGLLLSYLNRFSSMIKNSWRDLLDPQFSKKMDQNLVLDEVKTFPEDVDLLWEKVSPQFYAIVKRDRLHLNWKYVDQPHMDYVRIIARREGEVCGYLVMRKGKPPERNFGIISDLFVDPNDDRTVSSLLSFAVNHFRKDKVTEIIAATTIPEYQRCLAGLGFVKTGAEYPVIHARVNSPAIEMALEPGRWFLGNSDQDWDQYPLAR